MTDLELEQKLITILEKNLDGLLSKVKSDLGKDNFLRELNDLRQDIIYSTFSFDIPEYVLIRLVGRISISIGRRLGEIYDKLPRMIAMERYNLAPNQISPQLGNLEIDFALNFAHLAENHVTHIRTVIRHYFPAMTTDKGLGVEIRYNFNPNDSSRLRKDIQMGNNILQDGFSPIYLVFSSISPRTDAISRLKKSGWEFLVGNDAHDFMRDLLNFDIIHTLNKSKIQEQVKLKVDEIVRAMIMSFTFQSVIEKYWDA